MEVLSLSIADLLRNAIMRGALVNLNDRTHHISTLDLEDSVRLHNSLRNTDDLIFALREADGQAACSILKQDLDEQIE